jgi:hypothetical protein
VTNNTLPTRVKFLLCDDVRAEADAKLTIVGLYADDKIIVNTALNPAPIAAPSLPLPRGLPVYGVPQLAIASIVLDGIGTYPALGEFRDPKGNVIIRIVLGDALLVIGKTATLIVKGGTFPVTQFGTYKFVLTLGTTDFSFDFEILAGSSISGTTASPSLQPVRKGRAKKGKKKRKMKRSGTSVS